MPCASAMALTGTGWGAPWLTASSSMAIHAYSALAETRMSSTCCYLLSWSDAAAALVLDDVQAALLLDLARPAPGPLILAVGDRPGAGPAADARVALVVQRIVGHLVLDHKCPHVPRGPRQQRVDLDQVELGVPLDDAGRGAVHRLVAAD